MIIRISSILKAATCVLLAILLASTAGTINSFASGASGLIVIETASENGAGAAAAYIPSGTVKLFADVKRDDWAYMDIRKLTDADIVSGDKPPSDDELKSLGFRAAAAPFKPFFRPDDTLSREECAVIISRLDGEMGGAGAGSSVGSSFGSAVGSAVGLAASATEAAAATANATAAANTTAAASTRAGLLAERTFIDVPETRWSYKYIEASKQYILIINPREENRLFMPESPMSRGDLISALIRLTGAETKPVNYSLLNNYSDGGNAKNEWKPYVAYAIEKGFLLGDDEKALHLTDPVSRREACALIVRVLGGYMNFPEPEIPKLYVPDTDSGFYDMYFNEAVFVGDSITMGLRNYILNERARGNEPLANARFLCAGSYGLKQAAAKFNPGGVNLSYQGVDMALEDCLEKMGAKEAYIMLGMNDWAGASLPGSIEQYGTILDKIYAKCPDISLYIQFCTPITRSREATKLNNANTDKFNDAIVEMCGERRVDYVDVCTPMKDGGGALNPDYASDNYVHMSSAGCRVWIDALREFVKAKYVASVWAPPEGAAPAESYPGTYIELD